MSTLKLTPKLAALEQSIDYVFDDKDLLIRALTHRSFGALNNERLEFIGDGLVNAVVASMLYAAHPSLDEGSLSRLRSKLVSKEGLAVLGHRFDLGPLIRLGTGERKSGGRNRESILSDAVEAIAGAILIESGFERASEVVARWFREGLKQLDVSATRDAKTQLQEWLQGRGVALPVYSIMGVTGDDHDLCFEVSCSTDAGAHTTYGKASSRKKAEQIAAQAMLEILTNE